jgi:hypothetical protein
MDTLLGGESYVRNSARKQTNKKLPDSRKKKKEKKYPREIGLVTLERCRSFLMVSQWSFSLTVRQNTVIEMTQLRDR